MKRRSLLLGAAGAAAIVAGGDWFVARQTNGQTRFIAAANAQDAQGTILPDYSLGKADAPVTMYEYASFTCPHCRDFHNDVFDKLKADYIDTGKVRFILREVYFDKYGLWAGLIAQCGGAPKYYGIVDMIYNEQREWIGDGKDATIAANLRKIGLRAGLTQDQIEACLNDKTRAQNMVYTYQQNAQKDGIDATPSFVINGQKYSNMSYDDMKKILDEKLAG